MLAVILVLAIQQCICTWQSLAIQQINLPGHTYYVRVNQDQTLNGTITWQGLGDLRIMIYEKDSDLLGSEYIDTYSSSSQITFFRSDLDGEYYIRVEAISVESVYVQYTISVGASTNIYKQAFFYYGAGLGKKQAFLITGPTSPQFQIRHTALDSSMVPIVAYDLYSGATYTLQDLVPICLSSQNSWMIVVQDSIVGSTTLVPFTLKLEYNSDIAECMGCISGQTWNYTSQLCQSNSSGGNGASIDPPIGLIIGVSIGGVVLLAISIILIYYFCCRNKGTQYQAGNQSDTPKHVKNSQSLSDLKIDESIVCSICLEDKCNTALPCMHTYHSNCIHDWMTKNNQCPLCTNEFSASKIQNSTQLQK